MKLVKSLFLGSVAGLAAVAGAQAADLPVAKAAPVEYVRVCSTYGAGFFYIPGTETCLRVGGRVRTEMLYREPAFRAADAIGFRARGRIQLDARTATAYGMLRTFVRYEITRDSGTPYLFFPGSVGGTAGGVPTNGVNGLVGPFNVTPSSANVAQAFIQFGGLTAGRVTSFFSNPDLPTSHMGTLRFDDAPDVTLLAYTYSFGNGLSATVSLEDGLERRVAATGLVGGTLFGADAPVLLNYGGQRMPDVVGNIKYAGTWGSAQLSGALHQVTAVGGFDPITGGALPGINTDSELGFAVQGSVGINLPFLGQGDSAWIAATYVDGANAYILGGTGRQAFINNFPGLPISDAIIDPITGDLDTGTAWSIAGGITHNWTPTVRSSIFGSYARFNAPDGASTVVAATPATIAAGTAGASVGILDFNEYRLGANTFWAPISGLNLGVEVLYTKLDPRGQVAVPATNVVGTNSGLFGLSGGQDIWEGRLRVQRDF
ncbi:porin [Microvirga sp. Mcv34]|uniref:porin n=1 Tax=Microvirga sp. Mcv34 TaxID=2926016 RepID=UPI0021C83CD8|nr:porin [Microvirga sp. Mcv34]